MPRFWMITDRNLLKNAFGKERDSVTYWVGEAGPLDRFQSWSRVTEKVFRDGVGRASARFPRLQSWEHERQKHVTLFVHGYNNDWADAARRYESLCRTVYRDGDGLGICLLFSWPSDGMAAAYLPDRREARQCAPDLADVLSSIYEMLLLRQSEAVEDSARACRAKLSVIAHSMGNFLLQKAMQQSWTRKNQPLLVSLINQLVMVAADVDNDLFGTGEVTEGTDGDAIANLTYRVTALYSGRDSVLGMSAGLKHFGKRRLGRSGLDRTAPLPDNVWDIDCSHLFEEHQENIHSAYFEAPRTIELMKQVLQGSDRKIIERSYKGSG